MGRYIWRIQKDKVTALYIVLNFLKILALNGHFAPSKLLGAPEKIGLINDEVSFRKTKGNVKNPIGVHAEKPIPACLIQKDKLSRLISSISGTILL
jgi:hypothetical protein